MKTAFTVSEIQDNKIIGITLCEDKDTAIELFCRIVTEYGVEPWEELISEGIYEAESHYTVQINEF